MSSSSKTSQNRATLPFMSVTDWDQKLWASACSKPTAAASWSGETDEKQMRVWAAATGLMSAAGPMR